MTSSSAQSAHPIHRYIDASIANQNRLKEELNRLQSAQDDAERSLEILDFMASRMDSDPLVNPSLSSSNALLLKSSKLPIIHQHLGHLHSNGDSKEQEPPPPNLEYLHSNTMIRLANKQVVKVSDIKVGDKVLSLCINLYPQSNGKQRDSLLPKPFKRPSQSTATNTTTTNGNPHHHVNHKSPPNHVAKPLRKRKPITRSNTINTASVPFMLPPPIPHTHSAQNNLAKQSKRHSNKGTVCGIHCVFIFMDKVFANLRDVCT